MAILFSCGGCEQTMQVDDRHAGAQVRCPRCGKISLAPAAPARPAPPLPTIRPLVTPTAAGPVEEEIEPVDLTKRKREESELDMTPMVDVTFLLLIFFMITAAFNLQKSLEIPPPAQDETVSQDRIVDPEEGNIVVRIDRDSLVWVDEVEAPSKQDLIVKLREARRGVAGSESAPINSLLVMADSEAVYEVVVMALDAGNAAEMEQIKLAIVDEDNF